MILVIRLIEKLSNLIQCRREVLDENDGSIANAAIQNLII